MKHIAVVLLTLVLASCSSTPRLSMTEVAMQEAARMPKTAVLLSSYTKFELKKMALSDAVAANEGKVAAANTLDSLLQSRLSSLLTQWEINAQDKGTEKVLVIQPTLQRLRIVSGGARFWVGAWAGDSEIDMDLVLTDGISRNKVGTARVSRNADAYAGGWTVGATDQNLDNYIVEIAYQYLLNNY